MSAAVRQSYAETEERAAQVAAATCAYCILCAASNYMTAAVLHAALLGQWRGAELRRDKGAHRKGNSVLNICLLSHIGA
jgi:hypothetical protein